MIFSKKNNLIIDYDRTKMQPVIHTSICTGEKVAGFKHVDSGRFEDVMLIRNDADLSDFCKLYKINKTELKYEW